MSVVDGLGDVLPLVVVGGTALALSDNLFGDRRSRESEFDEEKQKRKERAPKRQRKMRRASSNDNGILGDLSGTSFEDFG